MTLIRVNPDSIRLYGGQAQNSFDEMHAALVALVNQVVSVRYFGPNAFAFKSEVGRVAADFANRLHLDLQAIADAVRSSTTNIASALGGAPIVIRVDPRPITPTAPLSVEYVDVDTSALEALNPVVTAKFEGLRQGLTANVAHLHATDWEGNAKRAVVDAVGRVTASAKGRCDAAESSITGFIRSQLHGVLAADR